MTDKERIARLEHVVGTLISWLHRELGTEGAVELLGMLNDPTPPMEALQAAAREAGDE